MTDYLIRRDESHEYLSDEGCYILELANSHADETCSIARARLPAGTKTRPHSLLRTVERYVILEGSGRVKVGEAPAESVLPYDIVHIAPDVSQEITNTGNEDLVFLCVCTPRFKQAAYTELD
jgi:mannose-6-phosphate isomerase-like protein (cupin superfamily)